MNKVNIKYRNYKKEIIEVKDCYYLGVTRDVDSDVDNIWSHTCYHFIINKKPEDIYRLVEMEPCND